MIDDLINGLSVSVLKIRAAHYYKAYQSERDSMSCGKALAETVNPRVLNAKINFNKIMDRLAVLDKHCPKTRL